MLQDGGGRQESLGQPLALASRNRGQEALNKSVLSRFLGPGVLQITRRETEKALNTGGEHQTQKQLSRSACMQLSEPVCVCPIEAVRRPHKLQPAVGQ